MKIYDRRSANSNGAKYNTQQIFWCYDAPCAYKQSRAHSPSESRRIHSASNENSQIFLASLHLSAK